MITREFIHRKLPLIGLVLALCLLVISMTGVNEVGDTDHWASNVSARVENRLEVLDRHIADAFENEPGGQMSMSVPEDMVLYHYVNDSLLFWHNQFPVTNDDITSIMIFQRLTPLNSRLVSPLSEITEELTYLNLGSKWYLAKAVDGEKNDRIIAGIEIKNSLINDISNSDNGINPALKLPVKYTVEPLGYSGGSAVYVDDHPLFKVIYESGAESPFFYSSILKWLALILFTLAMTLFLAGHRTVKAFLAVVPMITVLTAVAYVWGLKLNGIYEIFSPTIYADDVFPSLGALILLNGYILIMSICVFFIKGRITKFLTQDKGRAKVRLAIFGTVLIVLSGLLLVYSLITLRSFIMNSSVPLELYKINSRIGYAILVYLSYTGLLSCLLIYLQMLRPVIWEFTGKHYNVFERKHLILFAFVAALYFSLTASSLGFRKEQDRVMVWANRLAVERDLGLEIQLRSVEEAIAGDMLISTLTRMENSSGMVLNRVTEYYLNRTRQAYNIGVLLYREGDVPGQNIITSILQNGEPIADGSRFLFFSDKNGRGGYAGIFIYYQPEVGLTRMILQIEQKSNKEDRGYHNILSQFRQPTDVNIPSLYSYAKYRNGHLSSYKGNFPYPTVSNIYEKAGDGTEELAISRTKGNIHFISRISEDEIIVVTRSRRNAMLYFISFSYLFIFLALLMIAISGKRSRKDKSFKNNYFRTRINLILFTSSFLILASMAAVSIFFVYQRNEANMFNIMSSKISTVQGLLESRTRYANSWSDLNTPAFANALEDISNTTKSDITLFTPGGKVFRSTSPEVFEKLILGSRINQDAFYNIRNRNQRFYIHKEKIAGYQYWSLYAPIFNEQGDIIAIMSIPYTDRNYDFRREAFFHAAIIMNLFLLLLIISLLISTREVNSMFSPLVEMGKKMNSADINNLEYILYKRDDEISSLVDAYNRMVKDLSDSTRQLAQAERDKAWSQMARQVAHEIKNPLTPIKLEIQRLIRLKHNNNPKWEEKFDTVAAVVLEHIQILSETANEFSTFAKLYTEDPVLVDLDKTLKDQLVIFDNRENIRFTYIGMEEAYVMAPKPQLIRVFVNLITNAIQAVEIMQKEAEERGEAVCEGKIQIYLRNSIKEGCYDIVFDDNGPGVKGENLDKLFTPNFTTKTGGTGLGLAICRNIIQKCNGEITYQKSFTLNGASFTVTIPKHQS